MIMLRFFVVDTFNKQVMSKHHTEDQAIKARDKIFNDNKKVNGNNIKPIWEVWELSQYINVKVAIWDTEITLKTLHRNGDITLSVPYEYWENNTGMLGKYDKRISKSKDYDTYRRVKKCLLIASQKDRRGPVPDE